MKEIFSLIHRQKPDIVHLHTTNLFVLLIYLFLSYHNIPVVTTIHGVAHLENRNQWLKQKTLTNLIKYIINSSTEFIFLSYCRKLIVDTEYVAKLIENLKRQRKILRIPSISIIPQGVDSSFFRIENLSQSHHLISIGAFVKRKGHLLLVDSMVKVKCDLPDFSLAIVGALLDREYYSLLLNCISNYGLENSIKLFPNASTNEILKLLSTSEVFVLHSEEESQGIAFCEAFAAGKPVISTNSGGIPYIVENNVNGLISDFGDIDTFANNIVLLFNNQDLFNKIAENNKLKSKKYDWHIISNMVFNLYISML